MGNEASLIKKCTLSAKARASTEEWSLYDANHGNQQYSVFVLNGDKYFNDGKRWKHMRHPNLVKCYEAGLCKGKMCILTEPVTPIRGMLDKMHEYCKLSGLHNIGEALSFLHEICGISVNNLTIDSIFISRNDHNEIWKLGSLYWYSSLDTDSEEFFRQLIGFHTSHSTIKTLPPEDREVSTHKLIRSSKLIHRRDSHAFTNLISELLYDPKHPPKLADMILASECEVSSLSMTIKSFVDNFNSIQSDCRPTIAELLNNKLFINCIFLQIRQFFINFSTYNDYEKGRFFETFIERLRMLPDQQLVVNILILIVSSRVIMSSQFIYNHVMPYFLIPSPHEQNSDESQTNAADEALNCPPETCAEKPFTLTNGQVVTLSPIISARIYREYIIPHISNLFCVRDYKIRMLLLLYLPHYGPLFSKNCIRKLILPQILLGIKDSDNELVSLTFRAVAVLIDIFGVVNVLGGSKRCRYFNTGTPRESRLPSDNISQNDSNFDNLSTISAKSNSSLNTSFNFLNFKMPAHMISERSSPDGDEIDSNDRMIDDNSSLLASSKPSSNNLHLIEDEEEWPEWENGNESSNGFETAVESLESSEAIPVTTTTIETIVGNSLPVSSASQGKATTNNNKMPTEMKSKKGALQTFDIKEIDFKEVDNQEIDSLFSDMEPVFDFSHRKIINKKSGKKKNVPYRNESPTGPVDLNLFVPKHNDDEMDDLENSGWNEESLELTDEHEEIEICSTNAALAIDNGNFIAEDIDDDGAHKLTEGLDSLNLTDSSLPLHQQLDS